METKTNIAKAILAVMKDVKGIDKSMTVKMCIFEYESMFKMQKRKAIY